MLLSVVFSMLLIVCAFTTHQDGLVLVEAESGFRANGQHFSYTAVSKDHKTLIVAGGQSTLAWNVVTKQPLQTFSGNVFSPQILPTGMIFIGLFPKADNERRVTLWDVQECDLKTGDIKVLYAATDSEQPIALWPDRNIAVSYVQLRDHHLLKFSDYVKKTETRFVQSEPFKVLGFSPDKKIAALRYAKGKIRIFDWARSKKICEFDSGDDEDRFKPSKLRNWFFSADGKIGYAHFESQRIEKWDIEIGRLSKTWQASPYLGGSAPIAITPDHRHVISTLGTSVIAINLETGAEKVVGIKDSGRAEATAMSISPDGQKIAIGDNRGIVRILSVGKILP